MDSLQKVNRLSPSHVGTQPIRVLQHNIIFHFENANSTFLKVMIDSIFEKGLKLGIGYYINEEPICFKIDGHIQTPFVDSDKKIHIHETFASYVWCISYSLFVLYDEAVAKPSQNLFLNKEKNIIDYSRIEKTQELFNYGISLIKFFTVWDKDYLPNPEDYYKHDEFFVHRSNSIFVYAMTFILCHEYAHVEKEHIDKKINGKTSLADSIRFEKEADARAIELMLSGATNETQKSISAGILIGLCCLLFFKKETSNNSHPDTDERIHSFLITLDAKADDPIWGMAALAFKLWDNQFSKYYSWPKAVKDFKEMYLFIKNEVAMENKKMRKA
ncbi:MAG: phage exclusion protein Lit family protein [Chitinophagaceae bacterium]